jgi:hypothetical protein
MQACARRRKLLLRRLENPVGKLGDVRNSIDCFLILHARGCDDCNCAQVLRAQARRRSDQYQVMHARNCLFKADYNAHCLVAGVNLSIEQLDQPLFGLQRTQH